MFPYLADDSAHGDPQPCARDSRSTREVSPDAPHPRVDERPAAAGVTKLQSMPATVIVGAQWGDEGKGKIVDLLARDSDVVCRYQGGPNAGHTIVIDGQRFALHHVPSGILSGKLCVVGAGCVVDPGLLVDELDELEGRGISTETVRISGNAHLIMPWHVAVDSASERKLGRLQIGTTRRGIGPAYADKAARIGIRVQDILDPKILRQKFETALAETNLVLERIHGVPPLEVEELAGAHGGLRGAPAPVRRRHVAAGRPGAARREARPPGGRAGDAARPRPRHVSVRDLVQSRRRRRYDRSRHRPDAHRPRPRRRQGLRHARGRGPVPDRDRGGAVHARPRARRRVRDDDRPRAPLRLARPRRVAFRRARQRDDEPRADEARRPLRVRRDPRLHALPAARRHRDGRVPGSPERLPPRAARVRDAGRLEGLARRGGVARRPSETARAYISFVEEQLGVEVCLISVGAERERVVAPRGLAGVAG